MKIETIILKNLILNEEYTRKTIPFIKEQYFQDGVEKIIFKSIFDYIEKYNSNPTNEVLFIELEKTSFNEEQYKAAVNYLESEITKESDAKQQWLLDETEQWCKDKAIYNAVLDGIHIIDGKDKTRTPDALPTLLSDALKVSFDTNVGHSYTEQSEDRYDFYHEVEEKIPFDLEFFNKITKGGLPNKTLNIALAGTGVGKSLFMCHVAASTLMQGKNVLYITLEMAEYKIAERIDANLMNISMDDLHDLPKYMYEDRFDKVRKKTQGKLIVKEYPTAAAHTGHFRNLLSELQLKRDFVPDIIFVDYLNICASSRFRASAAVNSYTYIKAIAEELRGLAVECNLPIVSATQTTRTGFVSTDVGLEDTSESFGLPATADFMFALISTDELQEMNQMLIKQLKNRYNDPTLNKKFILGVDRAKMKLYDVSQKAQEDLVDTGQEEEIIDRFADFKV
jgi:archaellum biogenesis ATPase FlaH